MPFRGCVTARRDWQYEIILKKKDKMNNIILKTDSYKATHCSGVGSFYPPGLEYMYSYFESRGGRWDSTLFFGAQYILKKHLVGKVLTYEMIEEADEVYGMHFGNKNIFNKKDWVEILKSYGGYMPLSIKCVPEGLVIPNHNILMSVINTDKRFPWLTNYFETLLSTVWLTCTIGTQSREMRKLILKYLQKTGDESLIDFKLHDFGFRGSSSVESAGLGDCAHLISFKGTDTLEGVMVARKYYNEQMAGFSIPATEHSTMTSWGGEAHEIDAMQNALELYPNGLLAVVSDSFNIFEACSGKWGDELKDLVMSRNGTLVIRPDSGDPVEVLVTGTPNIFDILGERFGYTTNEKGYKVLDPHVRVIQGDGIDFEMLDKIMCAMMQKGWSIDNIAFGSGGGIMQVGISRDTLKFAFKCAEVVVNGIARPVFKNPITDKGKQSKSGRMKLVRVIGAHGTTYITVPENDPRPDVLEEVFRNGELLIDCSFSDVRARAKTWV